MKQQQQCMPCFRLRQVSVRSKRDIRDRKYVKNVPLSARYSRPDRAIEERAVVLALGPAGTGKTYLAIAKAVDALEAGRVNRIVLSRPAVEAGENLGFLPGDIGEKLAPYLRPLYDALTERLGTKRLKALLAEGAIEIAPVAYMRGRTLNDCFIVIDEAQNCTYGQIKMLLTRLGWRSTMVLTGDPDVRPTCCPGFRACGTLPTGSSASMACRRAPDGRRHCAASVGRWNARRALAR
jgi:phosphate starvation-inducible PhoH-like protein